MGADTIYLENVVRKAVEMVNLGRVENPGSTDSLVRRHKIRQSRPSVPFRTRDSGLGLTGHGSEQCRLPPEPTGR